jgi:hypothetical protein
MLSRRRHEEEEAKKETEEMTTIEAEEEWSTGVDDTMRLHRSATWPSFTRHE